MKRFSVSILILIAVLAPTIVLSFSGDRVSLGYIYNLSKSHTEIVNSSNENINVVAPTCFDLTTTGHLDINNMFSQEFVNNMHEQNIKVTPFLSNHWAKGKAKAALSKAGILSDEIIEAIQKYNLDGVNIDLENLDSKDKDQLVDFMRILKEKMPEDKVLSVAVAANPDKLTTTWVAAYDYENLAKYVDYMVLMAYDEHCEGGSAGPVASINFVEESIKVVLESVSRDKVLLGMPLYGRFWQEDAEVGGEAITMYQVERIASRYKKAMPKYNEYTGTATLTIEVEEEDKKAYVNGRYLEEGKYTIWYDNQKSFERKLEMMNEYGLKGAALWAIGNEGAHFWDYYGHGLANDDYQSEESIQAAIRYEQVERIMKEYKPIELEIPLKLNNITIGRIRLNSEFLLDEFDKNIHSPKTEEEEDMSAPVLSKESVILKNKKFKRINRVKLFHRIRRYQKKVS